MLPVKPYRSVPIRECAEKLIPVPQGALAFAEPHPYARLGAPYGAASPWTLRQSIVVSLQNAQKNLNIIRTGWKILLFDAYRPNAVQQFMVEHELTLLARAKGWHATQLTATQRDELLPQVLRIWAVPSDDPATPPPHSTGAAFDCTLLDAQGNEVDMGSPIDENSDRSYPDHFAAASDPPGQQPHAQRVFLNKLLSAEGFVRNPSEWWHFSRGDQLAVWAEYGLSPDHTAIYGRADLL